MEGDAGFVDLPSRCGAHEVQAVVGAAGSPQDHRTSAEDASDLNTSGTKEEPLRNECVVGRVLKEEQNKKRRALSTLQGRANVGSLLVSCWKKHRTFCVRLRLGYSLSLKPFRQPEF